MVKRSKKRGLRGHDEMTELRLYLDNEYSIHKQLKEIELNQARKACKGIWDVQKSAKLFGYAVDEAVRKYGQEFGSGRSLKTAPFSVSDRKQVALDLANEFKAGFNVCVKGGRNADCDFEDRTVAVIKKCPRPAVLSGRGKLKKRRK